MKILVCVKTVPDIQTSQPLMFHKDIPWVDESGVREYRMNRYDEFALEEAIRIRETTPNVTIDVISMGPERSQAAIRRGMAMGADNGIHIIDDSVGFVEAGYTAARLAAYAATQSYALILTGVMAEDDMQSLVGPALAAALSLPCATAVTRLEVENGKDRLTATCELEGGIAEVLEIRLPALLTIQSGINRPRYPSLSNMLRARGQSLIEIPAANLGPVARYVDISAIAYPPKSDRCEFLQGSAEQKAERLLQLCHEKSLLVKSMGPHKNEHFTDYRNNRGPIAGDTCGFGGRRESSINCAGRCAS